MGRKKAYQIKIEEKIAELEALSEQDQTAIDRIEERIEMREMLIEQLRDIATEDDDDQGDTDDDDDEEETPQSIGGVPIPGTQQAIDEMPQD